METNATTSNRRRDMQEAVSSALQALLDLLGRLPPTDFLAADGGIREGALYALLKEVCPRAAVRFYCFANIRKALTGSSGPCDLSGWLRTASGEQLRGLIERARCEVIDME